ncbi:MAG: OadG family protein, partial [Clostridia bacterium]|nr:OadG family protein [Clostridia bacterium]
MNLSEALTTGGMVTVTGVVIVFLVLIILMLVMMAMKKIFYKEPAKNEAPSGTKQ